MEEVLKFLQQTKVFYLATTEGDQPRVRPMGFVMSHKGKLYFCTNNTKSMFRQMKANPKIEICALNADNKTLRICGGIAFDTERETKVKALETAPALRRMYNPDDGIFTLFYFENAKAVITEFGSGKQEEFTL